MEFLPDRYSQWAVYPLRSEEQRREARQAGIDALHDQLLSNRGLTTIEQMQSFINARYKDLLDPLTLIDMPRALQRIRQALEQQEHITVYGDFDADGVTSSALLYRTLRSLKAPDATLDYHIPHRLRDGCGLNLPALDMLKARGTQLIITTDCASSDVEQADYASSLGIDIIVTDHHHPPAELPRVYAMVNPWRPDCTYGERYLCGVGIAFKLAQALFSAYGRPQQEAEDLLDLVAIGTVADIAPLLGENHTLTRLGLRLLNHTQKPGLRELIRISGLQPGRIRERDISFALAPRINAAGRMKEASIAFELLTSDNEQDVAARSAELEQLNIARQLETESLMQHVRAQSQRQPLNGIVLVNGDDWHEGIIGLVAGKLAEEIDKPVLVLSNDPQTHLSRGSARSRKYFNVIEALQGFSDHLERFGGHSQAAGFTIRSERIGDLHEYLLAQLAQQRPDAALPPATNEGTTSPDQTSVVTEKTPSEEATSNGSSAPTASEPHRAELVFTKFELLTYATYKNLRVLAPFGALNPEPIFCMEGVRVLGKKLSGMTRKNLNLRLGAPAGGPSSPSLSGTLTRGADLFPALNGVERVNIIFRLDSQEDERQEVWLKLLAVEPVRE